MFASVRIRQQKGGSIAKVIVLGTYPNNLLKMVCNPTDCV